MNDESPSALGPLFGPDFILVTVDDENKVPYSLEIFPDANNPLLKANGIATQYYFMPQRIYLAKKQDSPSDYDFGMTVFEGLMTSEDTVGITNSATTGDVETGGGFCTFATTFAIPDTVIANAIAALQNGQFGAPPSARLLPYIVNDSKDPAPKLGIVPILSNQVQIEIPQLSAAAGGGAPMFCQAQNADKGSIEAKGISSFLVTCNELAAGAIAGSLQAGVSPFSVNYALTTQFYLPACDIVVNIDLNKTFSSFSAALSASPFLCFDSATFQAAYSNCVTNGAITTDMKINEAAIPDDLKQMIMQQCQQMQQNAIDWVKDEIFSWQPTAPTAATAPSSGLLGSIFGGSSVSMNASYQQRSVNVSQQLTLDTTLAISDTASGTLSDLGAVVKANLSKYLAIVDIGQYFRKIQIAATNGVNWNEKLSDGTSLADPLLSCMIETAYPDDTNPMGTNKQPNLITLGQGLHYVVGQSTSTSGLAAWSATNPTDVINLSYLRLDNPPPQWPADQVQITKTLVFDGNDPRVDLSNNQTTVKVTTTGTDHTPVITSQEVGYVHAKFMVRPLPAAVTLTLTLTLGPRTDTISITASNQNNLIWEIFSDKYVALTSFQYSIQVQVQGPNFTDTPIVYSSPQPVTVALQPGLVKAFVSPISLQLPVAPPDQIDAINTYIKNYALQPA
jgi:hypothetical protein